MEDRDDAEEHLLLMLQDSDNAVPGRSGRSAPLSKNQQKRLLRVQRNQELREVRRKAEREKRKARRMQAKQAGIDLGKEKREAKDRPKHVFDAKVVIDLSFDQLMTDRELISMSHQLSALYNSNKVSSHPFSSIILSGPEETPLLDTALGKRMETNMKAHWRRWKSIALRMTGGLAGLDQRQGEEEAVCRRDQIIYLTADSDNILERVEVDKVYVIGGIVDRNRHKRLCIDKAERLGIQTAKLPVDPSRLSASTVLTVNQVVEILLAFNETKDWTQTMNRCLPGRKMKKWQEHDGVSSAPSLEGDEGEADVDIDALYNNTH